MGAPRGGCPLLAVFARGGGGWGRLRREQAGLRYWFNRTASKARHGSGGPRNRTPSESRRDESLGRCTDLVRGLARSANCRNVSRATFPGRLSAVIFFVSAVTLPVRLLVSLAILLHIRSTVAVAGDIASIRMSVSFAVFEAAAQTAVAPSVRHSILEAHTVTGIIVGVPVVMTSIVIVAAVAAKALVALVVACLVGMAVVVVIGMLAILAVAMVRAVVLPVSPPLLIVRIVGDVTIPVAVMPGIVIVAL